MLVAEDLTEGLPWLHQEAGEPEGRLMTASSYPTCFALNVVHAKATPGAPSPLLSGFAH